ncbi:MAG: AMP-binding protein [Rhodoblastus sp.]
MTYARADFLPVPFLPRDVDLERRADGVLLVRTRTALAPAPKSVPAMFRDIARANSETMWIAQRRGPERAWEKVSYGQALHRIDALTQALLDLGLPGRTIMALSGNSLELAALSLAAMQAKMPIAPITPAYSLLSEDHAKLIEMARLLKPAVLFVQSGTQFARALKALHGVGGLEAKIICAFDPTSDTDLQIADLFQTPVRTSMDAQVETIEGDTHAKYLFTSGSTGSPKAVITTQRMMCQAIPMFNQLVDDGGAQRRVILDWLPWSHVMGGSAQFNLVISVAGSLYIDDGRPTPDAFKETVRNIKELSPTSFANVPVGYAMLADAMDSDPELAGRFFARMRSLGYAGARMPDDLYARLQQHAVRCTGHKIPFTSGYGSTETAAATTYVYWATDRVGLIGLPHPGVEMKLLPVDGGRYEVRTRSVAVMPGYLDNSAATRAAFDEEGFYKMGDAATFVDPSDPNAGFLFAGRLTEDFKLLTGIFVHTEKLRSGLLEAAGPLVSDLVVTGADQAFIGLLAWPNLAACRRLLGMPDAAAHEIVRAGPVRDALRGALAKFNATHGSTSTHVRRALLLSAPPAFDRGEVTAKGNVNQRTVLNNRAADVARIYAGEPDADVLIID